MASLLILTFACLFAVPTHAQPPISNPSDADEILIQVKPSFPHRRFDEEYLRPQQSDIRDLTLQIDDLQAQGVNGPQLDALIARRDALIGQIESEKLSLANDIAAHNEKSFDAGISRLETFLAQFGAKGTREVNGQYRVKLPTGVRTRVLELPQVSSIRSAKGWATPRRICNTRSPL